MKLWMSGELQNDIAESYRQARKAVEAAVGEMLLPRDYGPGIAKLAFIAMIFGEHGPADFKEVKRYNRRDKSFEFRLRIDHDKFVSSSASDQCRLVCESLIRSLSLMKEMDVAGVDVAKLQADLEGVGRAKGWIV